MSTPEQREKWRTQYRKRYYANHEALKRKKRDYARSNKHQSVSYRASEQGQRVYREYIARNPQVVEATKVRSLERRERIKTYVDELKQASPCADCKQSFHPVAMDFDHLPGHTKLKSIAYMVMRRWSLSSIIEEIAKCEIVCSNCHRVRTIKRLKAVANGA
jgi:hypothetical protein